MPAKTPANFWYMGCVEYESSNVTCRYVRLPFVFTLFKKTLFKNFFGHAVWHVGS